MIAKLIATRNSPLFINLVFIVRVQEAVGSNPATRTIGKMSNFLFISREIGHFLCKMHAPSFMPNVQKVTFLCIHVHCFDCRIDCNSVASDCKIKRPPFGGLFYCLYRSVSIRRSLSFLISSITAIISTSSRISRKSM